MTNTIDPQIGDHTMDRKTTEAKKKKAPKVSHCCGAPVVKAPVPFESFICTKCVNMTIPVKR